MRDSMRPMKNVNASNSTTPHGRILGFFDAVKEAEGNAQEQHESDGGAAGEEREVHLYADDCAKDRRHHRKGEQQVSVAQDAVSGSVRACQSAASRLMCLVAWFQILRGLQMETDVRLRVKAQSFKCLNRMIVVS